MKINPHDHDKDLDSEANNSDKEIEEEIDSIAGALLELKLGFSLPVGYQHN